MNFEPQKFFIGLIDFFSVLMPGAMLTYLLKDDVARRFLGNAYREPEGTEGWIVFLFSSYLLGHLIFLVGSLLLDRLYDVIRNGTYGQQIAALAKERACSVTFVRLLAALFFKKDVDKAVDQAVRIKEHHLGPLNASGSVNAFQWCKARLALERPEALATVQRFEADSKFFRSLFVVLCILIPLAALECRWATAFIGVLVLSLAFWRFVDQRQKAINQAYWYIITLEGGRDSELRQTTAALAEGPTHAGGVVFRRLDDQVEYLLVRPKKGSPEWVLPKGHIERGEGIRETAVREVREETGIWASIRDELECVSFVVDGEPISVQFYLMEAVGRGCPSELREHAWMRLDEAAGNASHPETQRLLMSVKKIPEPLGTRSILRRLLQCAVATKQQHSGQQ